MYSKYNTFSKYNRCSRSNIFNNKFSNRCSNKFMSPSRPSASLNPFTNNSNSKQ